ncbi:hypothetical protein, partial [Pseudomonas sp. SWRI 103]|uniref:hypothetical protein n=1 Tax=Pseudomonas sp. SWRI 103 TaxID=2725411 RepID=UPI001C498A89
TEWWGEAFWVTFCALQKVTRRQGGTLSRRYRSNGYVLGQTEKNGRPKAARQAPRHTPLKVV